MERRCIVCRAQNMRFREEGKKFFPPILSHTKKKEKKLIRNLRKNTVKFKKNSLTFPSIIQENKATNSRQPETGHIPSTLENPPPSTNPRGAQEALLAIPRWIGEGRVWKLFTKPSLDSFVDELRMKWPAQIFPSGGAERFRAENRANEISLLENLLSRAREPAKWNFHFQSVSLSPPFVSSPFSSRSSYLRPSSISTARTRASIATLSPPPNDGADVHRVYSARGTIERSRTKRYEVGHVRQLPGSNQRLPSSRVGGGLFPLTRKIGLDNCRTTFPSSPLTLVCPSFFLEFPALVLTPPSLVSTIFPAKVCQEGKCGKFGKESGSRRTITKNPIILGRREDCNYRDYRIPEEANFSTLFNSCF